MLCLRLTRHLHATAQAIRCLRLTHHPNATAAAENTTIMGVAVEFSFSQSVRSQISPSIRNCAASFTQVPRSCVPVFLCVLMSIHVYISIDIQDMCLFLRLCVTCLSCGRVCVCAMCVCVYVCVRARAHARACVCVRAQVTRATLRNALCNSLG